MLDIQPLFFKDGVATNKRLGELAQQYCDNEFGVGSVILSKYQTVWVAVKGGVGENPRVVGVQAMGFKIDLGLHHVSNGSPVDCAAVSARLVRRLHEYLMDHGFENQELLIHCAPEAEPVWHEFFERMKAEPANRFQIKVKPNVEV